MYADDWNELTQRGRHWISPKCFILSNILLRKLKVNVILLQATVNGRVKVVIYNIQFTNLVAFLWRKWYFEMSVNVSATFTANYWVITPQDDPSYLEMWRNLPKLFVLLINFATCAFSVWDCKSTFHTTEVDSINIFRSSSWTKWPRDKINYFRPPFTFHVSRTSQNNFWIHHKGQLDFMASLRITELKEVKI